TLYYYGTGTAGKSQMLPLPANSIAYVKPGQSAKKQPTEELLANVNVVGPDSIAQTIVIDGDKPLYIPTEFTAADLTFTKSGEGYQALRLPFDAKASLGLVDVDGSADELPDGTVTAGLPALFLGNVNITESGRQVQAGTFAETESGYVYDGTSFVYAENISPFTYVWEEGSGISEIEDGELNTQLPTLNSQFYNLAGQRVSKPAKGLYIIGGKKVLVK
ncbi:MAG: hypothetical protein IKO60_05650, partial [Bacteroidaceae bacterium]|nr:hypothetical protein [Bacteroidaceae bacterium]